MKKIRIVYCEDNQNDDIFMRTSREISAVYHSRDICLEEKYLDTYEKSVEEMKALNLSHSDLVSIDSRLGEIGDAGEKIIRLLIDEQIKCFIVWHSTVKISPDLLPHVFVWRNNQEDLFHRYTSWVQGEYMNPRWYAHYLIPILLLCQGFIIVQAKNEDELDDVTQESLSKMKINDFSGIQVKTSAENDPTSPHWWLKSMGLREKDKCDFERRLAQEQDGFKSRLVELRKKEELKNNLEKLIDFIFSTTSDVYVETNVVASIYLTLRECFN